MFERILVPLDTSERAEMIVPYIQTLAGNLGSEVVLLSVVDPVIALEGISVGEMPFAVHFDENRLLQGIEQADAYLRDLKKIFEPLDISVRDRVECGRVAETILSVADEEDVSFIAIASHGRTAAANLVFGSIALKVLHQSDIPLILIRSPEVPDRA